MRACWLKWVGRDWSISADYIWLNYSGANTSPSLRQPPRFLNKARTDKARHNASRDERKEQCMSQRGHVEQQTAENLCITK